MIFRIGSDSFQGLTASAGINYSLITNVLATLALDKLLADIVARKMQLRMRQAELGCASIILVHTMQFWFVAGYRCLAANSPGIFMGKTINLNNFSYFALQNRKMNTRVHSEAKLPLVMWCP